MCSLLCGWANYYHLPCSACIKRNRSELPQSLCRCTSTLDFARTVNSKPSRCFVCAVKNEAFSTSLSQTSSIATRTWDHQKLSFFQSPLILAYSKIDSTEIDHPRNIDQRRHSCCSVAHSFSTRSAWRGNQSV